MSADRLAGAVVLLCLAVLCVLAFVPFLLRLLFTP